MYTAPFSVFWSAISGDTTPQEWFLGDAGAGGTFDTGTSFTMAWGLASFTFSYKNPAPGVYTVTVSPGTGPESGDTPVSATVTVTASLAYDDASSIEDILSVGEADLSPSVLPDSLFSIDEAELISSTLTGDTLSILDKEYTFDENSLIESFGTSGGDLIWIDDGSVDTSGTGGILSPTEREAEFIDGSFLMDSYGAAPDPLGYDDPSIPTELALSGEGSGEFCAATTGHSGVNQDWSLTGTIQNWDRTRRIFLNNRTKFPLTVCWFTYRDPFTIPFCGGYQCRYWSVELEYTETDESGNFSFSKSGVNLDHVEVRLGRWIQNPAYDPMDCTGQDADGNKNSWEYILDRTDPAFLCFGGIQAYSNGATSPDPFTHENTGRPNCPNYFLPTQINPFFTVFSTTQTGWFFPFNHDSTIWNIDYRVDEISVIEVFARVNGQSHFADLWYSNGYFAGFGNGKIRVTDRHGRSGIAPFGLGVNGLRVPDGVEWFWITRVEPIDHILTYDEISSVYAGPPAYPFPEGPPARPCQFFGFTTGVTVYPGVGQFVVNKSHVSNPFSFSRLTVDLGNFTRHGVDRDATSFKGNVVFAWVNSAGALKVTYHRSMLAHIGSPSSGWGAVTTLAGTYQDVQASFVHNGRCYIEALDTDGTPHTWLSSDMGKTWTVALSGFAISAEDFGQGLTAGCYVLTEGGHSAPYFAQVRNNKGDTFIAAPILGSGGEPTDPYTGCAFVKSGWCAMWNFFAEIHTAYIEGYPATTVDTLSTPHNTSTASITGLSGKGVGMVRGPAYSLILLLYDPVSRLSRLGWSGDRGNSFHQMSAAATLVPTILQAPALVSLDRGYAAVVWQEADAPKFRVTLDGGRSLQ